MSLQGPSQPRSRLKVPLEDSELGLSSEFWASPHLKGLFNFSPASLSRHSGSASRVRVISAFSLVSLPEVSGFLGEQMELRKAKGPGQPLPVPEPHRVKMCRPRDKGSGWAHT